MRAGRLNRLIASVGIPLGLVMLLVWRDLGLTVLVIGVINYVLYRRESDWVIV